MNIPKIPFLLQHYYYVYYVYQTHQKAKPLYKHTNNIISTSIKYVSEISRFTTLL